MARVRSVGSIKAELVTKAKESALCAIKVFNDPLIKFKTEPYGDRLDIPPSWVLSVQGH